MTDQTPPQSATNTVINDDIETNEPTSRVIENWDELDIDPSILRGIYAYGFEKPSPIQSKAVSPMLLEKDIIAQAQSGTGKTGCFTVGTLARVDFTKNDVQAIILSHTRELSLQTKNVIDSLGAFVKNYKSELLVGGTSTDTTIKALSDNKPQVIVGCPGRIYDMLRRRKLNTTKLKLIILDEADELLSAGFKEQVYNIFQHMPQNVQVGLFSATLPHEVHSLTDKFMRDPVKVLVKADQLTLEGISQFYVALEDDVQKYDCIKDIFASFSMTQCIIYCNSVKRVTDLHDAMIEDNYPVAQIHSGMDKDDRARAYKEFRNGITRVLISSNVTARGIDVQQVSTVINFDLPKCIHTYLHRIGRSGRWGRKGVGINFITRRDTKKLKEIESHYSTQIEEMPLNWAEKLDGI